MKSYLDIVRRVLEYGELKHNRTGVDAITIPGAMFEHEMSDGFPLLTTKRVPFRLVASELEFFIKGLTDKKWLQDRNNHIWDQWSSPDCTRYGHDASSREAMRAARDLGPIYGWQWRNFGADYVDYDREPRGGRVDQLARLIETLKTNPSDRRMIVSAWNPEDLRHMALPPCHYCFQVTVINSKLNLMWNQRSVDVALGLPFNIASYGLLLHLLAIESGLQEGRLIGFLADTHIYINHVDGLREQLTREPRKLPDISTVCPEVGILNWEYGQSTVIGYDHWPKISFDIAV